MRRQLPLLLEGGSVERCALSLNFTSRPTTTAFDNPVDPERNSTSAVGTGDFDRVPSF